MITINLAPPPDKPQRASRTAAAPVLDLGIVFGVLLVAVAGAFGGYWWKVSSELASVRGQIERGEQEKQRLQSVIAEGQRARAEKDELERRVSAIETVARNQARPVYLVDAMADALPADLWLTRVEEKGQQLRIAGTTYSSVILADFMSNLKASGKFRDVDLAESRQDLAKSPRTITFEVTCRFEI
jgi:Tfp pilus assembly protein PilN